MSFWKIEAAMTFLLLGAVGGAWGLSAGLVAFLAAWILLCVSWEMIDTIEGLKK